MNDPINQIKKRLEELEYEWNRVTSIPLPQRNGKDYHYNLNSNYRYDTSKAIKKKIEENKFALEILNSLIKTENL